MNSSVVELEYRRKEGWTALDFSLSRTISTELRSREYEIIVTKREIKLSQE